MIVSQNDLNNNLKEDFSKVNAKMNSKKDLKQSSKSASKSASKKGSKIDLKKDTKNDTSSDLINSNTNSTAIAEYQTLTSREVDEEVQLRPQNLTDYIGQAALVKQLKLILNSALMRNQMPEHLLFYGPPGLGKTTISSLIASELAAHFKIIAAPSLQKIGDIVSLLVNLEPNTVLFIDEIHRLKAPLEETLYSAMEDKKVDLLMGKGQGASVARIDLEPFVLVGATTQVGKLSKPLRDRFPSIFKLDPYTDSDMLSLIDRNVSLLHLSMDTRAKIAVCKRSRGVPRIANNILKRFVDLQTVHKVSNITGKMADDFLLELGIFEQGLTSSDIRYLRSLKQGSLGLKTISGVLLEEAETIELVIEPFLIHLGYINKDSSGRKLTPKGHDFIADFDKKTLI